MGTSRTLRLKDGAIFDMIFESRGETMSDVPDMVSMRPFTELDDGKWALTERVLGDPQKRRRLVRTQIEELWALYEYYPLPEFESVRQVLTQMRQAYSDIGPFRHPLLAMQSKDAFGPLSQKIPVRLRPQPSAKNADSTGTSIPSPVAVRRRFW
jgi:hypothetical protein